MLGPIVGQKEGINSTKLIGQGPLTLNNLPRRRVLFPVLPLNVHRVQQAVILLTNIGVKHIVRQVVNMMPLLLIHQRCHHTRLIILSLGNILDRSLL